MSEQSVEAVTLEKFLAWEERQSGRNELVDGKTYAMAGGSLRHDLLRDQVREVMGQMARIKGCRPLVERRLYVPPRTMYYPDFMIACGPAASDQFEDDAVLVLEVLSPSTRSTDRREKRLAYGTLRSIEAYVMAEPDFRSFEVVRWATREVRWESLGPGDSLLTPFGALSLDHVYDVVDSTVGEGH